MTGTARKLIGISTAALAGVIGFSFTDPSWTQRRFDPAKAPPLRQYENPSRAECVKQLKTYNSPDTPMDVLVVGGGSVGAGVALDAVTRGLSVGLVEMNDYASGTSSRSTKLIHGGIRYLEKAVFQLDPQQLGLVAEGLKERTIMLHQAPHLCNTVPTIIPCYNPFDIVMYWCGAKLYDLIAMWERGTLKYSGFLTPYATMDRFPLLKHENHNREVLLGSVEYYDGQMNDARFCLSLTLTAASYGAATTNYMKAEKMDLVRNKSGEMIVRTTLHDKMQREEFTVYSKTVVNAGGPFSAEVQQLITDKSNIHMAPSAGTHIIIDSKYCPKESAMVVPSKDGRVVFAISWLQGCLLGTTDRICTVSEDIKPAETDVEFLLKNIEEYVGKVPRESVQSSWCGIRPLALPANSPTGGTESIVREHMITVDTQGRMISVTGGKWTTYRKIAQDTVDTLRSALLQDCATLQACVTEELQMVGAHNLAAVPSDPPSDIPHDVHTHWRKNYGDRYSTLLEMVRRDPKLLTRLHPSEPVVGAEVVYAVKREHCERVQDFIARRTRISFLNVQRAKDVIPEVARIMAEVNNWGRSKKNEETANAFASLELFSAN